MRTHRLFVALGLFAPVFTASPGLAVEGRAWGDIHVRTVDGAIYEFQSAGEFVACRSEAGDLEVQLRLESAGFSSDVSVVTAVAVRIGSTRASVALGRDSLLFVDQQPARLDRDESLELPEGARVERTKRDYLFYWNDGSLLTVDVRDSHLNVYFRPAEARRATLTGLFGNFDGRADDDVDLATVLAGSASLSRAERSVADLARRLLTEEEDEALVAQERSLFEYAPGQSTHTFRRPKPPREASAAALTPSRRRQAKQTCEAAGVTDPRLLEACIVDVGYTRDESFAQTAATVQARDVPHWDENLPAGGGPGS